MNATTLASVRVEADSLLPRDRAELRGLRPGEFARVGTPNRIVENCVNRIGHFT